MFLSQLIIGTLLIGITVIIHAVALDRMMAAAEWAAPRAYRWFRMQWKAPLLVFIVLGTFLAHIVEIWLWAIFYLEIRALPDMETALYFSTSSFTTVGFGDIVLDADWRLISSFQAANGFILFGWSTAFIFEILSKLYTHEKISKTQQH